MPPRSTPTQRQRRLGTELRKMRLAAGITTEQAAGLLGVPRTNLPNMESGRSGISAVRVRTLASHYGCADAPYVEALADMASVPVRGWWREQQGQGLPAAFSDIAELEWHARHIRVVTTVHVPGLLQTEEHARALFRAVIPGLPESEVESRVRHRLARQQVLRDEGDAPRVQAVVHEAALRMQFGGPAVAGRQLERIADSTRRGHVALRVIPFTAGAFPGAGQSVVYAEGAVPALDTVLLDATHGVEFLDAESQLRKYRAQLMAAEQLALPESDSYDLVRSLADMLQERE